MECCYREIVPWLLRTERKRHMAYGPRSSQSEWDLAAIGWFCYR